MFSQFIILYLFLGGLGSGLVAVACADSLVLHAATERSRDQLSCIQRIKRRSLTVGFVVLAVGCLCLLFDLGRIDRAINLVLRPTATVISFGTFSLLACLGLSGTLILVDWLSLPRDIPGRVKAALEALCVAASLCVMAYTGLFLQNLVAVPFWNTPFIPALFVCSALSMGTSAFLLVASFSREQWALGASGPALQAIHGGLVVFEALCLAGLVCSAWLKGGAAALSVGVLFASPLSSWLTIGVLGLGIGAPFAASAWALYTKDGSGVALADVACIIGGLALRVCVVCAGLH